MPVEECERQALRSSIIENIHKLRKWKASVSVLVDGRTDARLEKVERWARKTYNTKKLRHLDELLESRLQEVFLAKLTQNLD